MALLNQSEKLLFNLVSDSIKPISFDNIFLSTEFKKNTCRRYLQILCDKGLLSRSIINNRTHFILSANGHQFSVSGKTAKADPSKLIKKFMEIMVQRQPAYLSYF